MLEKCRNNNNNKHNNNEPGILSLFMPVGLDIYICLFVSYLFVYSFMNSVEKREKFFKEPQKRRKIFFSFGRRLLKSLSKRIKLCLEMDHLNLIENVEL